jgi:hypothetical protein
MERSVRLVTRPLSGSQVRILVLIIVIMAVVVTWAAGSDLPAVITTMIGTSLASPGTLGDGPEASRSARPRRASA